MTASHSATVIVPEMQPGEGGFKEQGCRCKTGCSMHLVYSQSMEGESKLLSA